MIFVFGLVSGIALTLIFGGALPSFSNESDSSGLAVRDADEVVVVDEQEEEEPTVAVLAPVTEDDWVRGDLDKASVVLVEYSDFECPFCQRHHPTMEEVMDTYGDDVAWVYRHFPLSFHPEAEPSAIASECVGALAGDDAFWTFADAMFENMDDLGDDLYLEQALAVGVNETDFLDCYETEQYLDEVDEDANSGALAGVTGTPATFVNGILVSGAVDFDTFADIIDSELGN